MKALISSSNWFNFNLLSFVDECDENVCLGKEEMKHE